MDIVVYKGKRYVISMHPTALVGQYLYTAHGLLRVVASVRGGGCTILHAVDAADDACDWWVEVMAVAGGCFVVEMTPSE